MADAEDLRKSQSHPPHHQPPHGGLDPRRSREPFPGSLLAVEEQGEPDGHKARYDAEEGVGYELRRRHQSVTRDVENLGIAVHPTGNGRGRHARHDHRREGCDSEIPQDHLEGE